jgi:anthranilate synthase component 1
MRRGVAAGGCGGGAGTPYPAQSRKCRADLPTGVPIESNMTKDEYFEVVRRAKEYILAGDVFQVVPSQRFRRPFALPPFSLYRALRG